MTLVEAGFGGGAEHSRHKGIKEHEMFKPIPGCLAWTESRRVGEVHQLQGHFLGS